MPVPVVMAPDEIVTLPTVSEELFMLNVPPLTTSALESWRRLALPSCRVPAVTVTVVAAAEVVPPSTSREVELFWIRPVTFVPMTELMVASPVPVPMWVIVPALLSAPVEKVILSSPPRFSIVSDVVARDSAGERVGIRAGVVDDGNRQESRGIRGQGDRVGNRSGSSCR